MNTKRLAKIVICFLLVLTMLPACGTSGTNSSGAVTITFWGYGEATEIRIFRELVNQFNAAHEGEIYVDYQTKPGSSYYEMVEQVIAGNRCPDVVYVGDDVCKSWAINDYIVPLDDYVAKSDVIDLSNMWESGIQRYRYDVQTGLSKENSTLWALPKVPSRWMWR